MHQLTERLQGLGSPRVVLVGDFMLDRYVYGDAERISAEAPVPVLRVFRSESRTGGAGNVAAAILALGGQAVCIGVRGDDAAGDELKNVLVMAGCEASALIRLPGRHTTIKTRYVGLAQHRNEQQILRVDHDPLAAVEEDVATSLVAAARSEMRDAAIVAVQDHDKGVVTASTCAAIVAEARKAGVRVIVDPARLHDYRRYRGATVLTPNRFETHLATGMEITDEASLEAAARRVLDLTDAEAVIVTLDREGLLLVTRGAPARHVPTRPRAVYDGTGAGDEVLAMLAVALAGGCDYEEAMTLANVVGGLEVERFGVVPVTREEAVNELQRLVGLRGSKVVGRSQLAEEVARRQARGDVVVFTNGCFDLLHMGHVRYLRQARELGSCLIVAINSDESVRRLKGPARPVIGQDERAEMLGALECVDYVTIFEEDTPEALLELLRPGVLAKGGTTPVVVGRELVESYGGRVLTLDHVQGTSTTEIIERILTRSNGR
jgi:D-beta-D-heptose 7-phosphate kinase/D-beta-D-heptose 1-phosphate adenosyltransferase